MGKEKLTLQTLLKGKKEYSADELIEKLDIIDETELAFLATDLITEELVSKSFSCNKSRYILKGARLLRIDNIEKENADIQKLETILKKILGLINIKVESIKWDKKKHKISSKEHEEAKKLLIKLSSKIETTILDIQFKTSLQKETKKENEFELIKKIILTPHTDNYNFQYLAMVEILNNYPDFINAKNEKNEILLEHLFDQYFNEQEDNEKIRYMNYLEKMIYFCMQSPKLQLNKDQKTKLKNKILNQIDKQKRKKHKKSTKTNEFLQECINYLKSEKTEHYLLYKENKHHLHTAHSFQTHKFQTAEEIVEVNGKPYYDLTNMNIIAIDGNATVSRDDAVSITKQKNGHYILGIYITDTAVYVPWESPLFNEAIDKGLTQYLNKSYISMLPPELSKDLSSIHANQKRLVIAHMYEFNELFEPVNENPKIFRAIINASANLNYEQIDDIMKHRFHPLHETISYLAELTQKLELGHPYISQYHEFKKQKNKENNEKPNYEINHDNSLGANIVRYLMILNNYSVAKIAYANRHKYPFIYRNNTLDAYNKLLRNLKKQAKDNEMITEVIKCISKMESISEYSTINRGHQGLYMECYTHAGNPNRSAASLIVQHLEKEFMIDENFDEEFIAKLRKQLPYLCQTINDRCHSRRYIDAFQKRKKDKN